MLFSSPVYLFHSMYNVSQLFYGPVEKRHVLKTELGRAKRKNAKISWTKASVNISGENQVILGRFRLPRVCSIHSNLIHCWFWWKFHRVRTRCMCVCIPREPWYRRSDGCSTCWKTCTRRTCPCTLRCIYTRCRFAGTPRRTTSRRTTWCTFYTRLLSRRMLFLLQEEKQWFQGYKPWVKKPFSPFWKEISERVSMSSWSI